MRFMDAKETGYDPKNRLVALVEYTSTNKKGEEVIKHTVLKPATGYEETNLSYIVARKKFDFQCNCSQN